MLDPITAIKWVRLFFFYFCHLIEKKNFKFDNHTNFVLKIIHGKFDAYRYAKVHQAHIHFDLKVRVLTKQAF